MAEKKIPLRMCIGCAEHKPKKELVRIVKSPEGEIFVDLTGRKNGRGAYICHNGECLKKARKTRKLERTFSCEISDEIYDRLEGELAGKE